MHFASYYRWLVYSYLFGDDGFPPKTKAPVLDVGCKEADYLQQFDSSFKVGVDQSFTSLPKRSGALNLITADATYLPLRNRFFGYVILNDVLEHIRDDQTALYCVINAVASHGILWISTPGLHYHVGPNIITHQFEKAWGHVRKGYSPEMLEKMIGPGFEIRSILWHEPYIRLMQTPLWCLSRINMSLARGIASSCFRVDQTIYKHGKYLNSLEGHIYINAKRLD